VIQDVVEWCGGAITLREARRFRQLVSSGAIAPRPCVESLCGLAASFFMIGYLLFGVAMIRTATLPRWSASSLLWALPLTCSVSG
jgi:hypothetical protein